MSTSDWIALAALLVAIVGTGSATFYARRSAKTAEGAAASARKSADEAAALTAIEADRRAEERAEVHRRLGPVPPSEIELRFKPNPSIGGGHGALFAKIIVPNGYRAAAVAVLDNGAHVTTGLTSILRPNQPQEFEVEKWHADQVDPKTVNLWVRFWPPLEPDGLEMWDCACGRPRGESIDGGGHWEWKVPVRYEPPRRPGIRTAG